MIMRPPATPLASHMWHRTAGNEYASEGVAVPAGPGAPPLRGEASQWSGYIPEGSISEW
jgi:hypothetical protein